MKIKTIDQTILINAPAEKVWRVLWDKESYRKWAAAYMPGSHYTGDLKQGNHVRFLDSDNNGMESLIESLTAPHEITFRHLHELEGGNKGNDLGKMGEQYLLREQDGVTTLSMLSDMPEKYFSEMEAATENALQIVKELSEA